MSLNKKDYLDIIKTMEISDGSISNDQVSGIIKINIVGMKMQQQEKQISLKSIYDLVINSIENSNKRFDILEKDNKEIKQDISNMKTDINQLKNDNKEIKQEIQIVKEEMKIVNKRLDNIETDIKEIKALPTIIKELKQNKIL